ncbi:MAG: HD domain-containing protein [Spirochaetes bacterium]|nr:HD domain-containing protein [Spirochaetota bacterium]
MKLNELKNLFISYTENYLRGESEHDFNIKLKKNHSLLVADFCRYIAASENLSEKKADLSYSAGLLHDIGRFEQFKNYNTFHDAASVDHGDLGSQILCDSEFAEYFSSVEMRDLLFTVKYHNKKEFPHSDDLATLLTLIVRDADKLDIYRVITEMFNSDTAGLISHHLPDTHEYSMDIIEDILKGNQICYTRRKTRNDMKLTMLNWVQDLSFRYSFQHVKEKNYVEIICSTLPDTSDILEVKRYISEYIEKKS